jgi:hypothetical protein
VPAMIAPDVSRGSVPGFSQADKSLDAP